MMQHTLIRSSQSDQFADPISIIQKSDLAPLTTFQIFKEHSAAWTPVWSETKTKYLEHKTLCSGLW
jgi:hypothetical protein